MRKKYSPGSTPTAPTGVARPLQPARDRFGALPTAASIARALGALGAMGAVGGALVGGATACSKQDAPKRDVVTSASASASVSGAVASASASTSASIGSLFANGIDSSSPLASVGGIGSAAPSSSGKLAAASCSASVHVFPHVEPGLGHFPNMAGGISPVNPEPIGTKQPIPKVVESKVTVTGSESADAVRKVVRFSIGRLRACYRKGLASDPSLHGVVSTTFEILATGEVGGASTSSSMGNPGVEACIRNVFHSLVFPGSDGSTTVVYPFVFTTAGDA